MKEKLFYITATIAILTFMVLSCPDKIDPRDINELDNENEYMQLMLEKEVHNPVDHYNDSIGWYRFD